MCHITDSERGLVTGARPHRPSAAARGLSERGASGRPQEASQRFRRRSAETAGLVRARGYAMQAMPLTEWERSTATHPRSTFTPLFEDAGTTLLGWYRESNGYEVIRDRLGQRVWSDEIGLQTPLFTPLDLVGPGAFRVAGRLGIRFVGLFMARSASRQVARGLGWAAASAGAAAVIARLRRSALRAAESLASSVGAGGSASSMARLAASAHLRARAQELVARILREGRRVVVNIGGEASPNDIARWGDLARHAINLNPLDARRAAETVPRLVQTGAENIGRLFSRGQVDEIISMRLEPATMNWPQIVSGAHRVLRPGGRITINFQGHTDDIRAIVQAMNATRPPFRNIETFANTVVVAIR